MDTKICLVILLNVCQMFAYVEIQRSFEFENALSEEQSRFWVWRSEASRLKSLRLVDNYRRYLIELKICVEPAEGQQEARIMFDDIRYANDGPNDYIFLTFEDELWFSYATYEKWAHGHEWNIYRNTGRRGDVKTLPRGEYKIGVSVITDKWGLELDKIRLIGEYQVLDSTIFCGGRFIDTDPFQLNNNTEWFL
ncbi:hypothetical protein ACF0H5_000020 [Mactra antiquata]